MLRHLRPPRVVPLVAAEERQAVVYMAQGREAIGHRR